jgi:hypothetical protein
MTIARQTFMSLRTGAVVAILAAGLSSLATSRGDDVATDLPARIHAAVERGAAFLMARKAKAAARDAKHESLCTIDDTLVALALARAGGEKEKATAQRLLLEWWAGDKGAACRTANYELALALSAMDGLGLARVQTTQATTIDRYESGALPPKILSFLETGTRALVSGRKTLGSHGCAWDYTSWLASAHRDERPWDNSNTQFSVLALHDAARRGVTVPKNVAEQIALHFTAGRIKVDARSAAPRTNRRDFSGPRVAVAATSSTVGRAPAPGTSARQGADAPKKARWTYDDKHEPPRDRTKAVNSGVMSPQMTLAALSSLASAREIFGTTTQEIEDAIDEGLRDVDDLLPCKQSMESPVLALSGYHLYSLEKAFDLLEITEVDGKDWFAPIAEVLLKHQGTDGSWGSDGDCPQRPSTSCSSRGARCRGRASPGRRRASGPPTSSRDGRACAPSSSPSSSPRSRTPRRSRTPSSRRTRPTRASSASATPTTW